MSNPSKRKGTAAESAVAKYLRTVAFYIPDPNWPLLGLLRAVDEPLWPHAERRALEGDGDRGDIAGIPSVVIEVKADKSHAIGPWIKETMVEMRNAGVDYGLLVVKVPYRPVERWEAWMPMSQLGPVHKALYPNEDPWVCMELRHAVAEMALAGH